MTLRNGKAGGDDTWYKDILFRSRLEARWAVFLDAVGSGDYWYEPKRSQLPEDPSYLPDFWIPCKHPDTPWWLEIKPTDPRDWEQQLCAKLTCATKEIVRMFVGQPVLGKFYILTWSWVYGEDQPPRRTNVNDLADLCWVFGRNAYVVGAALEDASSARFEYGQRPKCVADLAELREVQRCNYRRLELERYWRTWVDSTVELYHWYPPWAVDAVAHLRRLRDESMKNIWTEPPTLFKMKHEEFKPTLARPFKKTLTDEEGAIAMVSAVAGIVPNMADLS